MTLFVTAAPSPTREACELAVENGLVTGFQSNTHAQRAGAAIVEFTAFAGLIVCRQRSIAQPPGRSNSVVVYETEDPTGLMLTGRFVAASDGGEVSEPAPIDSAIAWARERASTVLVQVDGQQYVVGRMARGDQPWNGEGRGAMRRFPYEPSAGRRPSYEVRAEFDDPMYAAFIAKRVERDPSVLGVEQSLTSPNVLRIRVPQRDRSVIDVVVAFVRDNPRPTTSAESAAAASALSGVSFDVE